MKPTKRERIDRWLKDKTSGYTFYARELGDAIGLRACDVAVYLKWHKRVQIFQDVYKGPNWMVV